MQGMRGQKRNKLIIDVFKGEVKPAVGCTELAAIGIVSSLALNAALDNLTKELGIARKNRSKKIS
jgi:L-cysteine desulfidase